MTGQELIDQIIHLGPEREVQLQVCDVTGPVDQIFVDDDGKILVFTSCDDCEEAQ